MSIQVFNTLNHQQEELAFSQSPLRFYSCGPTVYNYVHIGNLRAYYFADLVQRVLKFNGQSVRWVMNITDIDDKTIKDTVEKHGLTATVEHLRENTDFYYQEFLKDLVKINISPATIEFVKVTDTIPQIQDFILQLIEKGFAYKGDDGTIYFSIEKYQQEFGDYGRLVGEKFLEGKKVGARINSDNYDKENLSDFALWKATSPEDGNIYWEHETLGKGRPGWHIECTLINYLKFPEGTDIHTGGIDLLFPHHTNEIAQAQPIYKPFVKYWLHSDHILVNDQKMSKSLGNFYTLVDLEKEGTSSGLALRYLYLQSHFQSKLNVTKESLTAANNGLQNLHKEIANLKNGSGNGKVSEDLVQTFTQCLNDNLNTPEALATLFRTLSSSLSNEDKLATVLKMDEVLGLNLKDTKTQSFIEESALQEEVLELLKQRDQAREAKDYKKSDDLREKLAQLGYEVIDSPEGTKLRK
jgi:cysteinyl-tRNA synthetase